MDKPEFMSLNDKFAIGLKALELEKEGKTDEARQTMRQIPLPPLLRQPYQASAACCASAQGAHTAGCRKN